MKQLYPFVESLTTDRMVQAQMGQQAGPVMLASAPLQPALANGPPPYGTNSSPGPIASPSLYRNLYVEAGLADYMGLSLRDMQMNLHYVPENRQLTIAEAGFKRSQISPGVQEVSLRKDDKGKIGIALKAINKGVFVSCVWKDSPAARAGVRVGDQILQINGTNVAGFSSDQAMKMISKDVSPSFQVVLRDRPFERTITMVKDSTLHLGFIFKNGKITHIAKDSSAARNGLLIEHQVLEVNGQNVIGLNDDVTAGLLAQSGSPLTITIMPSCIFDIMAKNLSSSVMRKHMDHSIPDI